METFILLLVEALLFNVIHLIKRKPFCLVATNPFGGSHSIHWKSLPLAEDIPFGKTIPFKGIYSFYWKPFLLVGTILFSESHFF